MSRELVTETEKLCERAEEIDTKEENKLVREITLALKEKIREDNLLYLTAPQIGYNKRMFVINFSGTMITFINPIMTELKNITLNKETCNSIPGEWIIPRYKYIMVMYANPLGKVENKKLLGAGAYVFQHCMDHLNGTLLSHFGLEITEDYYKATEDEQAELIKAYIESLDLAAKELEKDIGKDEESAKMDEAIEFMNSVKKGETQIKQVPVKLVEEKEEERPKKRGRPKKEKTE